MIYYLNANDPHGGVMRALTRPFIMAFFTVFGVGLVSQVLFGRANLGGALVVPVFLVSIMHFPLADEVGLAPVMLSTALGATIAWFVFMLLV